MKNVKLTKKLMFGIGIILCTTFGVISYFFYYYAKTWYLTETYKKTELLLSYIDATEKYVRDDLRPRMFHVLPSDQFVPEAMSSTFVTSAIMKYFEKQFPEYIYRRVAIDPRNPRNMANREEKELVKRFSGYLQGAGEWRGLITIEGKRYFVNQKRVVMEVQCLQCHGNPSLAPKSLIDTYGKDHGFHRQVGDVVGVESVAIPVGEAFHQITQSAFFIFILGLSGMAATFVILNYFHYVVLVKPLKKVSSFFKSMATGEKNLDTRFELKGDDEISEMVGSFNQMISHLKTSQEKLAASEVKYRHIFEGSKDAIVLIDCAGPIRDVNPAGVELWGFGSKKDLIQDLSLDHFFATREMLHDFLALIGRDEFVRDYEAILRKKDGTEMHALITSTLRKDPDNRICAYECIIKDMTERKRMDERIREADKLACIGQLAAGVAHEINNPLSVVLGYTGLLLRDSPSGAGAKENLKEDLGTIHNNAQMCKKIVENLLHFSRQQKKPEYVETDVNQVLDGVVSVVERQFGRHGTTLARSFDPSIPPITIDVDKMRQVYMNVLINAYQATESGGHIRVGTCYDKAKQGVVIFFSDTGSGIPKTIQARIFEPFFTTKEPGKGTGLGLAVSYGIVKEHRGEIFFESEEGKGTTFSIWLPVNGKGQGGNA